MKLKCVGCGEEVSSELPENFVMRGVVECPDCLGEQLDELQETRQSMEEIVRLQDEAVEPQVETLDKEKVKVSLNDMMNHNQSVIEGIFKGAL